MPTNVRTRLPAEKREAAILEAATRAFARSNYRATGTAEISREAGVSEPTLYKYFPRKKALFLRVLERIREQILAIWGEVAAGEPGDELSMLRRVGFIYARNLRNHPNALKLQFQALAESDDPEIAEQLRLNHQAYVAFLSELFERGQELGSVRADLDARAAGRVLNGLGFTLTLVRLLELQDEIGDEQISRMIDACLEWLAAPPNSPKRQGV